MQAIIESDSGIQRSAEALKRTPTTIAQPEPVTKKLTTRGGDQNLLFIVSKDRAAVTAFKKQIEQDYGPNKSNSIVLVTNAQDLLTIIKAKLNEIAGTIPRLGILNFDDNSLAKTIVPMFKDILAAAKDKVHNIYTATTDEIKTKAGDDIKGHLVKTMTISFVLAANNQTERVHRDKIHTLLFLDSLDTDSEGYPKFSSET